VSGSVLLDIALVLLLLAYGYSGYRSGLIQSVFSLVGFFAFAMLGVWQLPELLARWQSVADDDRTRVLVLLLGVVVLGWIGQYLGSLLGSRIRRRMGQTSLRHVDSVLGAVVVTLAASLIIWFIGGALRTAGSPALSKAMAESKVLQVVNSVVPEETGQVFASFRGFLSSQGFPQVFGDLAPEPITPVQDPDPAVARSQAIRSAGRSVVKVTTQSQSCQRGQEGTGWVLSPGRIVTNAHVVAGADEVRVQGGDQVLRARVVVFDSRRDLAVLSVPGLLLPPLPLGGELKRGDSAAVPGYPLDGPYRVVSARVRAQLDARGLDIYGRERVVREIYSLAATVQPGNSGGPLLDTNGQVVGVIFAKSLEDDSTGYALTLAEAKPVLDEAAAAGAEVDTGACVAG
jgi:S1-C subfamily serine protease